MSSLRSSRTLVTSEELSKRVWSCSSREATDRESRAMPSKAASISGAASSSVPATTSSA